MNGKARRLESLRRLLAHVRERLSFDVGFLLWDGSTVPEQLRPTELAIVIADEGAIAALVRRPKLDTLINLWVSARFDIRNGSIFDLVARRPKVHTKATLKTLDKRLALATAARFWSIWKQSGHWHERGNRRGKYVMARFGDRGPYERGNVRIITHEENSAERKQNAEIRARIGAANRVAMKGKRNARGIHKNNTSGFVGVCRRKHSGLYEASIRVRGHLRYLGRYSTLEGAIAARRVAELELMT